MLLFQYPPNSGLDQASAGHRRPRRPRILNPLFRSLESCFVSQKFAHQSRMPWTETRMSGTTLRIGTTRFKDQGRRGRRRPEEPWFGQYSSKLNSVFYVNTKLVL